jgi:hypothetical protein
MLRLDHSRAARSESETSGGIGGEGEHGVLLYMDDHRKYITAGYIPVAAKNCGVAQLVEAVWDIQVQLSPHELNNSAFTGFPILTAEDHLFDRNRGSLFSYCS